MTDEPADLEKKKQKQAHLSGKTIACELTYLQMEAMDEAFKSWFNETYGKELTDHLWPEDRRYRLWFALFRAAFDKAGKKDRPTSGH